MDNSNYPKYIKYPRVPHLTEKPDILNEEVKIFEKLDGGNSQLRYYKGRILAGNRSKFLTEKDKRFEWFQQFLKWAKSNHSLFNLPGDVILYGEWLNQHTLKYSAENKNNFYFIDFFDINTKKFIDYSQAKDKIKKFGIEKIRFLDPLFKGKISEKELKNLVINESSCCRDGYMEGVVIKDYSSQSFAKLWRKSLVQKEINKDDIKRQMFNLGAEGKKISRKNILDGIIDDLERQKIPYNSRKIVNVVDDFLKHNKI